MVIIGIEHPELFCEITKEFFLLEPQDIKKYLEVFTKMKIRWNILQFGTGLKYISGLFLISVIKKNSEIL